MSEFQKRLKILRKKKGVSQKALAKRFQYGATTISGYENGRNEPSLDILIQLAEYFNVTVDYLIGKEDFPKRGIRMTEEESELLYNYRELTIEERNVVSAMAKILIVKK